MNDAQEKLIEETMAAILNTICASHSRRERIAAAALAGLLSRVAWSADQAAAAAVNYADALISELDGEAKP